MMKYQQLAVADPEFPRAGVTNPRGGGAPTYDFAKFSPKLHEIKRIWTGGGRSKFHYVDPPLACLFANIPFLMYSTTNFRIITFMCAFCIS